MRQAKFCFLVCLLVFLGVLPILPHLLLGRALHNGADWQDYGAKKKIRLGYKKNMNGANLPVFFSQVSGANPTDKSIFSCR